MAIRHLNDSSKVFPIDVVLCLHVEVTKLAGTHWVVLGIKLVKTLEGLSALMKAERVMS